MKQILSWAFYDWANSAFATTVMAGFFPIFFKEYWSAGTSAAVNTLQLGAANSTASVIIALLAPVLGAIADQGSTKKKFLLFFATLGIAMTGSFYFVAKGHWEMAAALYVLATIGFSGGNIFYDSLLVAVAPAGRLDFVSGLGYSLGYLGGGLLFTVNVLMTLMPHRFGLTDAAEAIRISFMSVAVWWGIFSLPILLFVREPRYRAPSPTAQNIRHGLQQLRITFAKIRKLRMVVLFLAGYWLYIDGVGTVIRMAVNYGMSLGFAPDSLIVALLITQFVGFPAAIGFAKIGEKWGTKTGIYIGIAVYVGVTVGGFFMHRVMEFYILAVLVGLVQGGVQSLSRAFYGRIIPQQQAAEFFGFYNMLGKFAAVLGPLLMGWVAVMANSPRYAILSVSLLFVLGAALLSRVDEAEGVRIARELDLKAPQDSGSAGPPSGLPHF